MMEAKHREIYKAHYGQRSIKKGNVIHHLDHNPDNDNIINLAQMSMGDHAKLHDTKHLQSMVKSRKYSDALDAPELPDFEVDDRQDNDDRSKIIWFDI